MKSTIAYLGILVTMFVNTTVANGIANEDQNRDQVTTETNFVSDSEATSFEIGIKKPIVETEFEINFSNLAINTTKSIAEIIEEDKKITEFQDEDYQPLTTVTKIVEVIKEDNQIIESTVTNEVYLLDLELIKNYENALKSEELKNAAFDKTNLKS